MDVKSWRTKTMSKGEWRTVFEAAKVLQKP
jgi:hypothetical protein